MLRGLGFPELLVILVFSAVFLLPFYRIFTKAGYPGIMSLTMIVPVLNVVMLFYLAFSEWPVCRDLNALRQRTPHL